MKAKETIELFDSYLAENGLHFEAVVIGGTALNLMGVVMRPTKDCDVLYPDLPPAILNAAKEFATSRRQAGNFLADDWLNNGPAMLARNLPAGWESRTQLVFSGRSIIFKSLGRLDLLRSKLFALCDRGIDLRDCLALRPTRQELDSVLPWLELQDGNPDWPGHVREVLADLRERLVNGI